MSTNGQAKVLTHDEIAWLFAAMGSPRDRAVFGILLYCGLWVSEAISLRPYDIKGAVLVLPAKATKGKLTRQIDIHSRLAALLAKYDYSPNSRYGADVVKQWETIFIHMGGLCRRFDHLRLLIDSSPGLLNSKTLFHKGYGFLGIKFA